MTGAVETSSRLCEHPGCNRKGRYRAPKSPEQLDEFLWFCQKHARAYNLKWNYFKTNEASQGRAENSESVGSAESQRKKQQQKAWQRHGVEDPFEILGSKSTRRHTGHDADISHLTPNEQRAIAILDVKPSWTKSKIRQQYTALVKDYHPDLNDGYREEEDRLRMVIWAWDQIKNSKHFAD